MSTIASNRSAMTKERKSSLYYEEELPVIQTDEKVEGNHVLIAEE